MPVELQILRIDNEQDIRPIRISALNNEKRLEDILTNNISFLDPNLLLIGHQVITPFNGRIDLLAINSEGNLWVIELKKGKTPRDVVSQLLDYGSWTSSLTYTDIKELYEQNNKDSFESAFENKFGNVPPESLNEAHQLVIVSSTLDPATERIIGYLASFNININALHFNCFTDDSREYLTRSWLIDPTDIDLNENAIKQNSKKEPWNTHDFYVSFGESPQRNWEDAVKYGFITAGGGRWYTNTLNQLFVGARVFVNIPGGVGYVGVGIVEELATPVSNFMVEQPDGSYTHLLELPLKAQNMGEYVGNPDLEEQVVKIKWIETRSKDKAYRELGFFGNQNTVCKFRNQFTLTKLVKYFNVDETLIH